MQEYIGYSVYCSSHVSGTHKSHGHIIFILKVH